MQCVFIKALLSAHSLAVTPFLLPVMTEAPSLEKLASLFLLMPESSTCLRIASAIDLASAEPVVDSSKTSLAAKNALLALPVSGCTNVTSCSLFETSPTSSEGIPKHLVLEISPTTCAFKTTNGKKHFSYRTSERCLKYLISSRLSCSSAARRLVNFLLAISSFASQYMSRKVLW